MPHDRAIATDRERVGHMLRAGRDVALQHALVHCVEVIGEAAARVSEAGRSRLPDLPWARMVGMRHILVHAYFNVDYDAVWRVVTEHVPAMIPLLERAAAEWPPG